LESTCRYALIQLWNSGYIKVDPDSEMVGDADCATANGITDIPMINATVHAARRTILIGQPMDAILSVAGQIASLRGL
jgi:hypothetical protein